LPVLFPDEAVSLNYKGYQPPATPRHHLADFLTSPQGEAQDVHQKWRNESHVRVGNYVSNNVSKDKTIRGYKPSTLNVNRRDTKKPLYVAPEYMNAMGSNLYYGGQRMLSGGVITTPEGQALLNDKLRQRIESLNTLDASAWGSPAGEVSSVLPPPTNLETQVVDDAFVQLADIVQSGFITSAVIDALAKANSSLLQVGAYLFPEQIADYVRTNDSLQLSVRAIKETGATTSDYGVKGEAKRLLSILASNLKRQRKVLEELSKIAYLGLPEKQLYLSSVRSQLLPAELASIRGTPTSVFGLEQSANVPITGVPSEQASKLERRTAARALRQQIRNPPM